MRGRLRALQSQSLHSPYGSPPMPAFSLRWSLLLIALPAFFITLPGMFAMATTWRRIESRGNDHVDEQF